MYSIIKNVQILVALLKEHQIKKIVISPGGNNIPIIHSLDIDSDFECYSVVDERSAAYFAMGLAQEANEVVGLVCTSGTAVSNYVPGLTEAKYQRVPLVVITSDRSPYLLHQLETQKINQIGIFGELCKKEVDLPIVKSSDDEWYCSRLVNEAIISATHRGCGPVHINVPTTGDSSDYSCTELPKVSPMRILSWEDMTDEVALSYSKEISKAEKVMLVFGENFVFPSKELSDRINDFCNKTKAVCLADSMSNIPEVKSIFSYRITETITESDFEALLPDLVITFGNNILSNSLKNYLRHHRTTVIHWSVDDAGEVRDIFKSLRCIFDCRTYSFFNWINPYLEARKDNGYWDKWQNEYEKSGTEIEEFSSLKVVGEFVKKIPEESLVHLAILNSTRTFHLTNEQHRLKVYSNIGALGIDGCMSSFIGQSFATDKLCFLIIGDLSFFYDMNSLGIRGIRNNVRILLLNNGGGSEFHFNMGKKNVPTLNQFISVEHGKSAKGWVESLGFDYYSIYNPSELAYLDHLTENNDKPVVVEVFTDMEKDADIIKNAYESNRYSRSTSGKLKGALLNILKK